MKYVKIFLNPDNAGEYLNHSYIIQEISESDGKYGTNLIAKLYDQDQDIYVYVRLTTTVLQDIIRQGYTRSEELIGKKVKLKLIAGKTKTHLGIQVLGD